MGLVKEFLPLILEAFPFSGFSLLHLGENSKSIVGLKYSFAAYVFYFLLCGASFSLAVATRVLTGPRKYWTFRRFLARFLLISVLAYKHGFCYILRE